MNSNIEVFAAVENHGDILYRQLNYRYVQGRRCSPTRVALELHYMKLILFNEY